MENVSSKNIWQAYVNGLKKYFKLKGRTSRYDYFGFCIINALISFVLFFVGGVAFIYSLLVLIPSYTIYCRRLHDVNKSVFAYFVLPIILITISALFLKTGNLIVTIIALILMIMSIIYICKRGSLEDNEYGEPVFETESQVKKGKYFACLLMLYLVLMILLGWIQGYTYAMNKFNVNKTIDQIKMTSLNIKEMNKDKNNYDVVSNEWAIKNNIAMGDMYDGVNSSTLTHRLGGAVSLYPVDLNNIGVNDGFMVSIDGISKESCMELTASKDMYVLEGHNLELIDLSVYKDKTKVTCEECGLGDCALACVFK